VAKNRPKREGIIMQRHHFKLRVRREGPHIRVTIFSGAENQTLANCGELVFRDGEYQLFSTLLSLGYNSPSVIKRDCYLTIEDEEQALNPGKEAKDAQETTT